MTTSLLAEFAFAQSYTSYFTGDTSDVNTITAGGTVLMGGATENDNAMIWFLQHSGGGDVVVIRATGSDGYNNYLYSTLGVAVNSVETIVFNNAAASHDPHVINQIRNAEALWIAGGNQWDYVSYWKKTPIDSAINYLINVKHVPVGGASAGMAVLGGIVNTAQGGSVTSATALNNPYNSAITLQKDSFIVNPILKNIITDTHYGNPDRRGRHIAFLARLFKDYGVAPAGIACEEYTAVCIDTNGIAKIYGDYPANDDYAYFLKVNCVLPNAPENCAPGQPLTWNRNNDAVRVYKVAGTQNGSNSFNLHDWLGAVGGEWQRWSVTNGSLIIDTSATTAPFCPTSINETDLSTIDALTVFPNPAQQFFTVQLRNNIFDVTIMDVMGRKMFEEKDVFALTQIDTKDFSNGIYFIRVTSENKSVSKKITIQR